MSDGSPSRHSAAVAIGSSSTMRTMATTRGQPREPNDTEELLMMFPASPDTHTYAHADDNQEASGWLSSTVSPIASNGSTTSYPKSTAAEMAAFSNVVPVSALDSCISNLSRSKPPSENPLSCSSPDAEAAVAPLAQLSIFDAALHSRHPLNIASTSRRKTPLKSIDSTFSYDSYVTTITSPATSFDEGGSFPILTPSSDPDNRSHALDKGKGKATQVDDIVDSGSFASPPQDTAALSISLPHHQHQLLLSSSPDGLGRYSPDVADLLPPFELERKAFDWDEFERSLSMSPGAGSSSKPVSTALGLSVSSSPVATPVESPIAVAHQLGSLFFPIEQTSQVLLGPPTTAKPEQLEGVDEPAPSTSSVAPPQQRKPAVSMYETSAPDTNRKSVSYRTSVVIAGHDQHAFSSTRSSRAPSILSRTRSASPSPRIKKRALTFPSWFSKGKESRAPSIRSITPVEGSTDTGKDKLTLHKPKRLHKERKRANTTPVPFPFLVSPDGVVSSTQPLLTDGDVTPEASGEVKPIEQVSPFEQMLHREMKLWIFAQLVVLHQEDFERRLAQKQWSVLHANHERWVGKDAGMRELVKLTRVSKSWQGLALDGQLWQTFDLMAFPGLSSSLVLKIAQGAGAFVQRLNLQGHHHLKPSSLLALSTSFSLPCSPLEPSTSLPTTQLTSINLVACTSITTHSLHYLLLRSPHLKHLFLRGLDSVTNTTLTEILGPRCRHLTTLDIRRCSNVSGRGLQTFAEQCIARAMDRDTPAPLKVLKIAGMRDTTVEVFRAIGRSFPLLEVLDAAYCRDLVNECFRAFIEWPTTTEGLSTDDIPKEVAEDWKKFNNVIELTSREAGFDPGDPTKYWRRVTALRHLSVSGCRHITDFACSLLAFTVPKLEFLEMAGIGGDIHDDGLLRLFRTTPKIRKIDLEDATDITDAVLDCLIPEPRTPTASFGRRTMGKQGQGQDSQPGEMLEHLTISYAALITPEAMNRLVRGCKQLRVFEADNTRLTGNVMRDFVSRRRHREKGVALKEGDGSEIVGIDCRSVSDNTVKDLKAITRPRRGWRGWEARDLGYEDGLSVGVLDRTTGTVAGPLIGQDECDEKRVVIKSFHSWVGVDAVAEQKAKMKQARENGGSGGTKNVDLPRWLSQWSLGRRSPAQSTTETPDEEREDRGCIVQ